MRVSRWLAGFALAVAIVHHVGVLAKPLGHVGSTEWADWIDLLTPYAVVGTALGTLVAAGRTRRALMLPLFATRRVRRVWLLAAVGTVVYVQGHGIHLAANSVGNARGAGQPVHLWDEVVGHYLWYAGLYLLLVALALAVPRLPAGPPAWPLAALVGLTLATNAVEGGTPYLTLVVTVALAGWAWRRHDAVMLLVAGLPAALLAGWGLWHQGFPQFSELGWI